MFDLIRPVRYAGAVEVYDSVITADDCDKVLRYASTLPWERSATGEGMQTDIRTSSSTFIPLQALTNPTFIYEIGRTVYRYLDAYGKKYQVGFGTIEPACINRYEPGQEYRAHADDGVPSPRIVSALIYLNDVEEGGETHFPLFDVTVKPSKGRLIVFPSNFAYLHEARPPLSGEKYSMAIWAKPLGF